MKALTIAGLVTIAVLTALTPVLSTLVTEAFPDDSAKQRALAQCRQADPGFNRLLAAARTACYEQYRNAQPARPGTQPPPANTASRPLRVT